MIALSLLLVLAALVLLLLGVSGYGDEPLWFVYASIGACLLAAVLLVTGVLRRRPSRLPRLVDHPHLPSWSGARGPVPPQPATPPPAPGAVLDLGEDRGPDPFVQALAGLDLDVARTERLRGRFVTVERLAAASVDELCEVPGIDEPLARAVHDRLRAPR